MSAVLRITFSKIINSKSIPGVAISGATNDFFSIRKISSKATKLPSLSAKPQPWPYEVKKYNLLHSFFDKTTSRIDENSKIIVVEGPIASGKTKFAKHLATELDMLYLPEANLDMVYINDYGFDLKTLDSELPELLRSFDISDWLKNPKHINAASFQLNQFAVRYSQYIDALAHVLSTGQGVVLDRSVYSDFVFIEAMFSQKFISKNARKAYYEFRNNTIYELLRPHLVIYLDIPVNKTLENIKKRDIAVECKSPAMTKEYLSVMEHNYKQNYLREISKHAELLVYDWTEGGDPEVVVEDIERIDFDKYEDENEKLGDWSFKVEEDWAVARATYADGKDRLINYLNVPTLYAPELFSDGEDQLKFLQVMQQAPGMKYAEGYNAEMGDKNILFKNFVKPRKTLPRTERRFP